MRSVVSVTTPAKAHNLVTPYEVKVGLKISTSDDTYDEMIEMLIDQASQEIATICNRVFAKETVVETLRDIPEDRVELFMSRYPITKVNSVTENGTALTEGTDYEMEAVTGRLIRLDSVWTEPVIVDYVGGYECPFDVPDDLRRAAMMYTREAYYQVIRGDQSVRMISHKESRIIYFDPNTALRGLGAGGGGMSMFATPTQRALRNMLNHYTRFAV